MADGYDTLLLRLVAALKANTESARHDIYDRARHTLLRQLKSTTPPYTTEEIRTEQLKLDAAISRTEFQYAATKTYAEGFLKHLSLRSRTTIALLSLLILTILVCFAYLYFRSIPNSASALLQQSHPQLLDREQAMKLLVGSVPVLKDFSLTISVDELQRPGRPGENTFWVPKNLTVHEMLALVKADELDFNAQVKAFQADTWRISDWIKPVITLRVYWNTGLFETMTMIPSPGIAKFWVFTLKEPWRPFCTLQNGAQYVAGAQSCNANVSTRSPSEITGIAGDRATSAFVEFVVTQTQTPFGAQAKSAFERINPYELREFQQSSELFTAEFVRYDDGWRVQRVQKKQ
jgi:hypothetical protein